MSTSNKPILTSNRHVVWATTFFSTIVAGLIVITALKWILYLERAGSGDIDASLSVLFAVAIRNAFVASSIDAPFVIGCLSVAFCLTAATGAATYNFMNLHTPRRLNANYISGANYAEGNDVGWKAAALLADDRNLSGLGVALSPDVVLPRNREIQSILAIGRPRYGKSTAIRYLLDGILARPNDKLIVYDSKGDVTAEWPGVDVILLAPHDTRSWAWAVGQDVLGETGAREFTSALIPVSEDEPNWGLGGQEIMIAVVRGLQATKDTQWSWQDLDDIANLPDRELRRWAQLYHRPALRYLTLDPDTLEFDRTAASYVSTAMSAVHKIVRPLSQAWRMIHPSYQVSLRAWLRDEAPARRTLIFQAAAHLPAISTAWISAALDMMARFCVGPALPDSTERRVWYVLDEFSTVPKISAMSNLLAQGPSKGICLILACQNLELVEDVYGKTTMQSIVQNVDIHLLFRLNAGPTSLYLTETSIPKTEIRRLGYKEDTDEKGSGKLPHDIETLCLVTPYDLATLPRGEGFAVIEGSILRMRWPKSAWTEQRPPIIEASWVTEQDPAAS